MHSLRCILTLLLALFVFGLHAQEEIITPEAIAESLTKNLEGNLKLKGDQLQKVSAINQEYAQALVALRRPETAGLEKGASVKKLLTDYDAAMKETLTPDQYQQFQQIKDEQVQQLRKAGLERSTARLAEELALSEEQIAQVTAINEKYSPQLQAIRESGEPGRNKMRQVQLLNGERNEELKAVLTADQYAKYQEWQAERRQEMRGRWQQNRE